MLVWILISIAYKEKGWVDCDPQNIFTVTALGANFRKEPHRSPETENGVLKRGISVCVLKIEFVEGYEKPWAHVRLSTGDYGWMSSETIGKIAK